jgi:hypothetical protein
MSINNSQHNFVPLALAARLVYLEAYDFAPGAHLSNRLNNLADALARSGTMYAVEDGKLRAISGEELSAGLFRHGAAELHFLDERPPLTRLLVTKESVDATVKSLHGPNRCSSK